jgi:hypothetical protein
VAVVATFPNINIATGQLDSRVGLDTLDGLGGGFLEKQGNDLNHTADQKYQQDQYDHEKVVGFDLLVRETAGVLIA